MNSSSTDLRYGNFSTDGYSIYANITYYLIAMIGIVENVITFLVIVSSRSMRTGVNFYLLNLALADLIILSLLSPIYFFIALNSDLDCILR